MSIGKRLRFFFFSFFRTFVCVSVSFTTELTHCSTISSSMHFILFHFFDTHSAAVVVSVVTLLINLHIDGSTTHHITDSEYDIFTQFFLFVSNEKCNNVTRAHSKRHTAYAKANPVAGFARHRRYYLLLFMHSKWRWKKRNERKRKKWNEMYAKHWRCRCLFVARHRHNLSTSLDFSVCVCLRASFVPKIYEQISTNQPTNQQRTATATIT